MGHDRASTRPSLCQRRDREFISTLGTDLRLSVSWDEYDEEDQNLGTWHVPGSMEEPIAELGSGQNKDEDDEQ